MPSCPDGYYLYFDRELLQKIEKASQEWAGTWEHVMGKRRCVASHSRGEITDPVIVLTSIESVNDHHS